MNVELEQLLLVLLTLFPLYYKYSFWLFIIQSKKYSFQEWEKYIGSSQGKRGLFNFWFFIEVPLLIVGVSIFINHRFEIMIFPIIFYFLVFYNIFVIGKLLRKKLLKPKMTSRLGLTALLIVIGCIIDFYFILFGGYWTSVYVYILGMLLFAPVIIFFYVLLSLPVVKYLEKREK